jgi:hypothetical protein
VALKTLTKTRALALTLLLRQGHPINRQEGEHLLSSSSPRCEMVGLAI